MASGAGKQLCLVVGNPKGFTRSVIEALLKRGSRVVLTNSNQALVHQEQKRLSSLYGSSQLYYMPCNPESDTEVEAVFLRVLDTLGDLSLVVNSTANTPVSLDRVEIEETRDMTKLNRRIDRKLIRQDVEGIKRLGRLATKYMGKQSGAGAGGSLLNISSSTELSPGAEAGQCTVLGTTRALGLVPGVARSGLRVTTVYHPAVDYTDLSWRSVQITDDQHSPYTGGQDTINKYSCYLREYTGYMALHTADTGPPGAAWAFTPEWRLQQVTPGQLKTCCGIANKMCYWLGCPMVSDTSGEAEEVRMARPSLRESQESGDQGGQVSQTETVLTDR